MFMEAVRERVRGKGTRVVYPEGAEERAIRAAVILRDQALLQPVLLGTRATIEERAQSFGIGLAGIELREPASDPALEGYAAAYHALRKHKGVSLDEARARAALPHYFGALMVQSGAAGGMVSGLNSETKPFLPAFEIVGMREGMKRASSVFVMDWPDRVLFYADCSVNIAPDASTLAEIGRATGASQSLLPFQSNSAIH